MGSALRGVSNRRKNLVELNAALLLWGGTAMFAKLITLPAIQITALRSPVAMAAMLVVVALHREQLALANRRDLLLILIGGLALGLHWVTYFQSMQVSTVAVGILSLHTYPVMTALLEPIFFKERFHLIDLGVALVVLIGVSILVPEISLHSKTTQGVLWGIFSALLFCIRNLITRSVVQTYSGRVIMLYQLLAISVVLFPFALWRGAPVGWPNSFKLVLLGVVFTALPHTLYTNSLQNLKARTVGVIGTLLPLYGTLAAMLFLREIPSPRTAIGGAIILSAVLFESLRVMRVPE